MQLINFKTLQPPKTPNYFLACPENYCATKPDRITHAYAVNSVTLQTTWSELVLRQPRTKVLREDLANQQIDYQQRSRFFRFPDFITVQFISLSPHSSTLAIFSRSKYGHSDLGVNRQRIETWLRLLDNTLNPLLNVHP